MILNAAGSEFWLNHTNDVPSSAETPVSRPHWLELGAVRTVRADEVFGQGAPRTRDVEKTGREAL